MELRPYDGDRAGPPLGDGAGLYSLNPGCQV